MTVKILGLEELKRALQEILERLQDRRQVTKPLADRMEDYVHRDTGYLASTIFWNDEIAGATAPYAGIEEERGGGHAYGSKAIQNFNIDAYSDTVVEPF